MSDLPDIDDLWDDDEEKGRFQKTMLPFLLSGFLDGAELHGRITQPELLLTPAVKKRLTGKSLRYAALSARTTKQALKRQIDLAVANGESVRQLAKRIDALYGSPMGYRSLRIARTQLTETINAGTVAALVDEGNRYKQWSAVVDGRERPSHHAANGQIVPIGEMFQLAGGKGMHPGDENLPVNETALCRCSVVAPGTSPRRQQAMARVFLRTHGSLERAYVVSLRRAFRSQRNRITSRLPS